jgi:hypothetical protein
MSKNISRWRGTPRSLRVTRAPGAQKPQQKERGAGRCRDETGSHSGKTEAWKRPDAETQPAAQHDLQARRCDERQ